MGLNWEDLLLLYLGDDDVEVVGVFEFLEDLIDQVIKKGTQLNAATQGVPGLARAGKSTARAFHWPSLPVCGGLAPFSAL
jgi:hypothetical protein